MNIDVVLLLLIIILRRLVIIILKSLNLNIINLSLYLVRTLLAPPILNFYPPNRLFLLVRS